MRALVCCAILLLVCAFAQVEGGCQYKEETLTVGKHHRDCLTITCHENGSMSSLACPVMQCRNEIGYQETDLSKPFPECCARPICQD
ncbi:uncharacterized protein LOC113562983 [Ooceraea biroi]|uniref:Single domain-containing protein n=1 Tax=Ooceraea biroi TaxID=2015173 RepID=A0A026WIJ5_OOCBI|nr:uncharacterized protein LOC113562983 [Ooceraea biroi]EZA55867.1 hypothetical protein X777_04086 [Ooceraea biroi]